MLASDSWRKWKRQMDKPEAKLAEINRLLACYQQGASVDPEMALRNYITAVSDYDAIDVAAAVDCIIKGSAPGLNLSFLPPPPALGAEVRRQMNLRLESEARSQAFRPRLPRPDVQRTPEEEARVKAGFAALIESLSANLR